jgi:hypothetical protein
VFTVVIPETSYSYARLLKGNSGGLNMSLFTLAGISQEGFWSLNTSTVRSILHFTASHVELNILMSQLIQRFQ